MNGTLGPGPPCSRDPGPYRPSPYAVWARRAAGTVSRDIRRSPPYSASARRDRRGASSCCERAVHLGCVFFPCFFGGAFRGAPVPFRNPSFPSGLFPRVRGSHMRPADDTPHAPAPVPAVHEEPLAARRHHPEAKALQLRVPDVMRGIAGLERPDSGFGACYGFHLGVLPCSCSGEQNPPWILHSPNLTGESNFISRTCLFLQHRRCGPGVRMDPDMPLPACRFFRPLPGYPGRSANHASP